MAGQPKKVSGIEVATQIVASLMIAVQKAGGSYDDVRDLSEPEGQPLIERFAKMIVEIKKGIGDLVRCFVDYSMSLEALILGGKYNNIDPMINEDNFPPPKAGKGKKTLLMELVNFGQDMKTEEVTDEFKKRGLRPATLWELLTFGILYPQRQRETFILALGSVYHHPERDNVSCYVGLGGSSASRDLELWEDDDDCWGSDFSFLAVQEAA